MENLDSAILAKIREQFDSLPYPQVPIDQSPRNTSTFDELFIHNLVTPYYLHFQKIVDTSDKVILDAGCGSGYKSLILAEANPGAKVVGVDLSEASIAFARLRLQHHGFENVEFHAMPLEAVPQLGMQFDYINCDEVLSIVPEPLACLQALQSVLTDTGILRCNFHSHFQRQAVYRAQAMFKMMGLMEGNPGDEEVELVAEVMKALKPDVDLKMKTWFAELEDVTKQANRERILMNYMLQGDRGFTIPDVFSLLRESHLEFISMVQWRQWELNNVFHHPDDLPLFLAMSLPEISIEERLHLFELIHPVNRLIDFWCTPAHPTAAQPPQEDFRDWTDQQWQEATIHLHPQLRSAKVKQILETGIQERKAIDLRQFISLSSFAPIILDFIDAACLLPLWDQPQSFSAILARWQAICPINPLTLEPMSLTASVQRVQELLLKLETFLYIMIEAP